MRGQWMWVAMLALASGVAHSDDDISQVLERSQSERLERLPLAPQDSERARKVHASFEALVHQLGLDDAVELRVIRGEVVAETLHGRVVVANESLGARSEPQRLFVLAHELGHLALGHWLQIGDIYQKWVPGSVTPERTDPVAGRLGREASQLAHRQEYEADAYAYRALQALGLSREVVLSAFMQLGSTPESATHPSTQKRLAALRAGGIKLPPPEAPGNR